MKVDTLEIFRRYTGEKTFSRIKHYNSMAQMWEERAVEFADLTAIVDDGKTYTYRQLARDVAAYRTVLAESGVKKGDAVALLLPNSYEFVKAYLAAVTLGCTAAILPAFLDAAAVFGCCMMFRPSALVSSATTAAQAALAREKLPELKILDAAQTAEAETPAAQVEGKDGCTIILTGGTTGRPKGALLSNTAVLQGCVNSCLGVPHAFEQRYLLCLPLSHVFGLIRNLLASLYSGSALMICRNNKDMFRDAAMFKPTIMVLVPALAEMAMTLSKKFGRNMFGDSLETIICGAATVPPYLVEEYDKLGVALYPGYGLTESANLVSGNPEPLKKPGSVGLMFPEQEYKIVNGELWLKGKNMMDGYIAADNTEAYEDGWFKTGDLVRFDDDGFLYITGRIKEVIVLPSGENVSPAELEAQFNTLNLIQDSQVFEDVDESGKHFLALEVVPRATETAKLGAVDVSAVITEELEKINATLPPFARVNKITVRTSDFERTPAMKIVRYKKCQ